MQIGKSYLKNDTEIEKADNTHFTIEDETRLVNNGLAFVFQEGRVSTSSGTERENKYLRPVSTIMRLLTQKDRSIILFR